MSVSLPSLPGSADRAVQMPANVMDPAYYLFMRQMLAVVVEQRAQIETLRVALNEARQNPTTTYPAVPAF